MTNQRKRSGRWVIYEKAIYIEASRWLRSHQLRIMGDSCNSPLVDHSCNVAVVATKILLINSMCSPLWKKIGQQMSHLDYSEFLDELINAAAFSTCAIYADESSKALFPGVYTFPFHFTKITCKLANNMQMSYQKHFFLEYIHSLFTSPKSPVS